MSSRIENSHSATDSLFGGHGHRLCLADDDGYFGLGNRFGNGFASDAARDHVAVAFALGLVDRNTGGAGSTWKMKDDVERVTRERRNNVQSDEVYRGKMMTNSSQPGYSHRFLAKS